MKAGLDLRLGFINHIQSKFNLTAGYFYIKKKKKKQDQIGYSEIWNSSFFYFIFKINRYIKRNNQK
jgi:hypothetical protein